MGKIFRCGWCGFPTNKYGNPIDCDPKIYLEENKYSEVEHTHGECCQHEHESQKMQVARDMALDAGCPEMEG